VFPDARPHDGIVSGQQPAREKKAMKKTLIAIAFAAASLPMFAAQTPAPAPAKPAVKTTKKAHKKVTKKTAEKKPVAPAAAPVVK
jgi:hypothetical protein